MNRRSFMQTIGTGAAVMPFLPTFSIRDAFGQNTNLFQNPFNHLAAHHRPMGSTATFGGSGHAMVIKLNAFSFGSINSNNGYGCNVYQNKISDPFKTVRARAWTKPTWGLPVMLRMPFMRNPEQGTELETDAVISMLDRTVSPPVWHEFYHWKWNDGLPSAHGHRTYVTTGSGNCGPGRPRLGNSASGLPTIFGLNRGFEVNSEAFGPIMHVMQMTLPVECFKEEAVWPAGYTNGGTQSGVIPYGQLFAIPRDITMPANLSPLGKRIFAQLRNYGIYAIDSTANSIKSRAAQDINNTAKSALLTAMNTLKPLLQPVLNNRETQTASGGGTPIAPNGAFDT